MTRASHALFVGFALTENLCLAVAATGSAKELEWASLVHEISCPATSFLINQNSYAYIRPVKLYFFLLLFYHVTVKLCLGGYIPLFRERSVFLPLGLWGFDPP